MHWLRLGAALGFLIALALGGCGKKGPLYLPHDAVAGPVVPATATR